jgi:hypothetical protein
MKPCDTTVFAQIAEPSLHLLGVKPDRKQEIEHNQMSQKSKPSKIAPRKLSIIKPT